VQVMKDTFHLFFDYTNPSKPAMLLFQSKLNPPELEVPAFVCCRL
jgi:hypothetical protein